MRWTEYVAPTGVKRKGIKSFGAETRRNEPLGRPRCRWENNMKISLKQGGCELD
jgi:hypothetical protein